MSIKLDILSDPICPWCYIGWTNLARAMEQRADHPFVVEWHPFQLNPDMPPQGMDRATYLETKFGGRANAATAYAPVLEHAEKAGLSTDFAAIPRTPNTLNAHRLIHWAGLEGRQTAAAVAIFKAYFISHRDIGAADVLEGIASEIGLDRAMIARLLAGDADQADITARDQHARTRGVTGVPCFIIANQHVVTGAQPSDFWLNVIDELNQQVQETAPE
ncbi:MAG: DsbA family oxidoreductase [Paracoccaceae bacterium]